MSNSPKQLPNRDNVTSQQCDTLLQVAGLMASVIINPHRDFEASGTKLDGGAHTAAVNTFVNACAKLDEIINAKDRFTFEPQNLIEAQYFQLLKQNTLFTREQTEAIRELNTPHSRYRPDIMKLRDGNWAVVLGPEGDLENSIVGVGVTPQEAINAFDGMFTGNLPQTLVDYLAAREKAIDTNKPLPEYPAHELDTKGTATPNRPSRRRKNRKTNRGGPR
jgi:hypothetical protein